MFWIAQKLLYTTCTRSGPVPASRRRAAAAKSAPAAPLRPVRVVGYAEPRGSLHTAPGCSEPLSASIPVASSRLRHEIASSRCTSGAARRPVPTVQVPPGISTIGQDARTTSPDVGRSFYMQYGHAGTMETSAPFTPVDLPTQRASLHSVGGLWVSRTPTAMPGARRHLGPAFVIA